MIANIIHGDVLDTGLSVIVHGCNAQGVMGSGVAKAIRQKYPKAYHDYRAIYQHQGLELGSVVWSKQPDGVWIGNAITQHQYGRAPRRYVDYDAINDAMISIVDECALLGKSRIAMPKIGAGLGGGDWEIITKIINAATLDKLMIDVYQL